MAKVRVLLAGESWMSAGVHLKGFDHFNTADFQIGITALQTSLAGSEIDLLHMPGHLVPSEFPMSLDALSSFHVIALSDIGANSLLLHPDTFVRGRRTANRLALIAEWVQKGGGLVMIGGYLSFQGIN